VLLVILGTAFVAAGVLLFVVADPWMAAVGVCFGAMSVLGGIAMLLGTMTRGAEILTLISGALFGLTGALMLLSGLLAPAAWGWRGGGTAVIAGSITLVFFGGGTLLYVFVRMRRRRARRTRK